MIESHVRDLIFDKVLAAAIKSIQAAIPFFNLPVIKIVFEFVIKKIAKVLYEHLSQYVVFTLIDMRVSRERDEYKAALEDLKTVSAKPAVTKEEKDAAEEKFSNALGALIALKP